MSFVHLSSDFKSDFKSWKTKKSLLADKISLTDNLKTH